MRIGAHVSVAGGFVKGLEYARSVGAECLQFFAKSPRQWKGPPVTRESAAAFCAARLDGPAVPTFTHTAYLLNLSSVDPVLSDKTVVALADEYVRASLLGVDGVVTHVGNDPERNDAAAARRAAGAILAARELAGEGASGVRLLLENTAGGGSSFGCTFNQLASIMDSAGLSEELLGVCLDTCHAFAYGMPLTDEDGWSSVVDDMAAAFGLGRLALIHANDCMYELGSRRDRHAWIGDGYIGSAGFKAMLCHSALDHVSVVTEMPGEKPEKDVVNLERLKALRDQCRGSHVGDQ